MLRLNDSGPTRLKEEIPMPGIRPKPSTNQRGTSPMRCQFSCTAAGLLITALAGAARADVVTDWNQIMAKTVLAAKTSPLVTTRVAAIVQAAVFDAVNG